MSQLGRAHEDKQPLWIPPILLPVLAFVAGIAFEERCPSLTWLPFVSLPVGLAGYWAFGRKMRAALVCLLALAFSAGVLRHYAFNQVYPPNDIRTFVDNDEDDTPLAKIWLTGWVSTPAVISQPPKAFPYHSSPDLRTRFLVEARDVRIGGRVYPTCGRVEVSLPGMIDRYQPGQEVRLKGRLVSTRITAVNFPFPTRYSYYINNRIPARLLVRSPEEVIILSRDKTRWNAILDKGRQMARTILLGSDPPTGENTSGLLMAFVLGDRYQMQNELNQAMMKIGATHLLAVSGFNLAVLAGGFWAICTIVGLSRRTSTLVIMVTTLIYALLTDLQPSVVRATIMILFVSLGTLLNRQTNALNSLALAALLILLVNPNQLFDPGFQLSFVSTVSLVVLSRPLYDLLFPRPGMVPSDPVPGEEPKSGRLMWAMFLDRTKLLFCASLAAAVGTLPLVLYHFKFLSLMGPVSSAVLYIPATLLTLAGYIQLVASAVIPPLGAGLSTATNYISSTFSALAILLSKMPGTSFDAPPPAWYLIAGYLGAIFWPVLRGRSEIGSRRVRSILLLFCVCTYLTTWAWGGWTSKAWVFVPSDPESQTTILCDGKNLNFINCGASHEGKLTELTRQISCRFLAKPQSAIVTCPNQAFFNELPSLGSRYPDMNIFLTPGFESGLAKRNEPVQTLLNSEFHKRTVAAGTEISSSGVRMRILFPPQDLATLPGSSGDDGGTVVAECGTITIVSAAKLTPYMCLSIRRNMNLPRVDGLVIHSSSVRGNPLVGLIRHLRPQRLIVTGTLRNQAREWYRSLAKEEGIEFLEAVRTGGVFFDETDRVRSDSRLKF